MDSQPLYIIRGTTNTFEIYLTDADGQPYTLKLSEQLIFGVKLSPCDVEYKISKTLTPADYGDGKYILTLNPTDSETLPISDYFYDIGLQSDTDYYMVVECSRFSICPNITHMVVTE